MGARGIQIAIDGGDNPHVAFNLYSQSGATYDFGLGSFSPIVINNNNAVLVKYSSSGTVLSSKYATAARGNHFFNRLAFDASDNPIVVSVAFQGDCTYTGGLNFTISSLNGHLLLKF